MKKHLVLFLACLLACSPDQNKQEKKQRSSRAVSVEVFEIQKGPIERLLMTSRELEAEQSVKVVSRTSGRVIELLVEEGDRVVKGQLLARLEDDIQQSTLAKAENLAAKSRDEFKRQKSLYEQDLISDQVYRDAQYDLKALDLSVEDARRELAYTEIRATIDGTITSRMIQLGDEVSNAQSLFDLIDFDSIVARLYVPDKELSVLAIGQEVRVTANAFPDQTFDAFVLRISPIVTANSGTIKVTIAFREIGPLRPGIYVDAGIVVERKDDAILIPKKALVFDGARQYVFRLKADRRVERIALQPGLQDALWVESLSDLVPGDQVVIAGQAGLKDDALVKLPNDPDPETKDEPKKVGWFSRLFEGKGD